MYDKTVTNLYKSYNHVWVEIEDCRNCKKTVKNGLNILNGFPHE